jgi:hypothetical protein
MDKRHEKRYEKGNLDGTTVGDNANLMETTCYRNRVDSRGVVCRSIVGYNGGEFF